jgi:hypothetical protein
VLFSIDASELGIWLSPKANIKAGKKFPIIPTVKNKIKFFLLRVFILLMAMGRKNINAKHIRRAADCAGVYARSPFFIKMNELPHISDIKIIAIHCVIFLSKIKFFASLFLGLQK